VRGPVTAAVCLALLSGGCFLTHGPDEPPPDAAWVVPEDGGACTPGSACDCRAADPVPAGVHLVGANLPWEPRCDPFCDVDLSGPAHEVTLTRGVWLGRHEATSGCYGRCVREGGCSAGDVLFLSSPDAPPSNIEEGCWREPSNALLPVVDLAYDAASRYCAWLGGRLPTNAEWEKAARGERGKRWPWAPDPVDPENVTWDELSVLQREWRTEIPAHIPAAEYGGDAVVPVGSFPDGRGRYGHLDLVGNAAEWVLDWLVMYTAEPEVDPRGPTGPAGPLPDWPDARTLRGWDFFVWDRTPADPVHRERENYSVWSTTSHPIGARCAFDAPPEPLPMWESMEVGAGAR